MWFLVDFEKKNFFFQAKKILSDFENFQISQYEAQFGGSHGDESKCENIVMVFTMFFWSLLCARRT